jgi:hypothetical protein
VLTSSWGVLLVYALLHGLAAYLTYRDPRWFQVLVESIRFRYHLYRLHYHSEAWSAVARRTCILVGIGLVLIYGLTVWLW